MLFRSSLTRNNWLRKHLFLRSAEGFAITLASWSSIGPKDLKTLFDNVKHEDASYRLIDYYPYMLLLDHALSFLKHCNDNISALLSDDDKNKIDEGKDIQEKIERYKDQLSGLELLASDINIHLKENLNKCISLRYKPYYLPFENCFIRNEEDIRPDAPGQEGLTTPERNVIGDLRFFVSSSYVLPNSYKQVEEKSLRYDKEFSDLVESVKLKLGNYSQLKFFEKSFRKEIENKEFKLVQALAMFITLASLALSTIATFGKLSAREAANVPVLDRKSVV